MSAPRVELAEWAVQPVRLGEQVLAQMRAQYRSDRLPLTQARVALTLRGATPAVAGALRRALLESVPHACLAFSAVDTSESADAYMTEDFLRTRLAQVPVRMPLLSRILMRQRRPGSLHPRRCCGSSMRLHRNIATMHRSLLSTRYLPLTSPLVPPSRSCITPISWRRRRMG